MTFRVRVRMLQILLIWVFLYMEGNFFSMLRKWVYFKYLSYWTKRGLK